MRKLVKIALLLILLLSLAACNGCNKTSAQQRAERNIALLFTTYVSGDYGPCG